MLFRSVTLGTLPPMWLMALRQDVNPVPLAQVRRINPAIPDYAPGGIRELANQEDSRKAGYDSDSTTQ